MAESDLEGILTPASWLLRISWWLYISLFLLVVEKRKDEGGKGNGG
jgi:hypothetical protein